MKIVLFTDTQHDILLDSFHDSMKIAEIENLVDFYHVWNAYDLQSVARNADYVFIDGSTIQTESDGFFSRTANFLKQIMEQSQNTEWIITGGFGWSYYENYLTEFKDFHLSYKDMKMIPDFMEQIETKQKQTGRKRK